MPKKKKKSFSPVCETSPLLLSCPGSHKLKNPALLNSANRLAYIWFSFHMVIQMLWLVRHWERNKNYFPRMKKSCFNSVQVNYTDFLSGWCWLRLNRSNTVPEELSKNIIKVMACLTTYMCSYGILLSEVPWAAEQGCPMASHPSPDMFIISVLNSSW